MAVLGFTFGRDITIDTTTAGLAMPITAFKSILDIVQGIENRIAGGETVATILVGAKIPVVGKSKHQYAIHVFDMYGDFGAGTYAFEYVETVPNAESIS
ncbi:MAG: hypothetical protein KAS32_09500 [Candidatus Peribacteraceae bacterium]|nr:hypothetical protein [Candidatus Peribacteraceae bacterium]